jgi:hypothetical protein
MARKNGFPYQVRSTSAQGGAALCPGIGNRNHHLAPKEQNKPRAWDGGCNKLLISEELETKWS